MQLAAQDISQLTYPSRQHCARAKCQVKPLIRTPRDARVTRAAPRSPASQVLRAPLAARLQFLCAVQETGRLPRASLCAGAAPAGTYCLCVTREPDRMDRARQLSAESAASGDPTSWFERLYEAGEAGTAVVPWVQGVPNESLVGWAADRRV